MGVATYASGTQTCTLTTEHFLSSPNVAGEFMLALDFNALAANDLLEVRIYKMVIAGGTQREIAFASFSGSQANDALVWLSGIWIPNSLTDTNALRFSIKQTVGTGCDIPWNVMIRNAEADVTKWNGTAVSSPATAGIPDINVKNINNVSASSVTTVSANQGTTQPINFTGTGASALAKSDMVDVAGA